MRKTELKAICKKCGKINSRDCLHCKVIKQLFRPKERKHDIWHHDDRKWEVTAEIELAKKATQEATAKDDDTGMHLVEEEEENPSTTELAKAISNNVSADEVKKMFKDKHVFLNHEGVLLSLFCKFVDCWSITKVSTASDYSKSNLQARIKHRINKFLGITEKKKIRSGQISPDLIFRISQKSCAIYLRKIKCYIIKIRSLFPHFPSLE